MILIFGGAAQGQETIADLLKRASTEDLADLADLDFDSVKPTTPLLIHSCKAWLDKELYTAEAELEAKLQELVEGLPPGSLILAEDCGSGIVPLEAAERARREQNGRMLQILARLATKVYRVFAGTALQLKGQ